MSCRSQPGCTRIRGSVVISSGPRLHSLTLMRSGWQGGVRGCPIGPRSWRRPPHRPLWQAQASQHRLRDLLWLTRSSPPSGTLFFTAPRVVTQRGHQDRLYTVSPLARCDKLAQYVGILRQSSKEPKKLWKNVPPSCCVASSGRRGDRGPLSPVIGFWKPWHCV